MLGFDVFSLIINLWIILMILWFQCLQLCNCCWATYDIHLKLQLTQPSSQICNENLNFYSIITKRWCGGEELLNKVVIFVFFVYKMYSRSFIKLWFNHWCNMDYFNNVLMFLGLGTFQLHCCLWRIRKLSYFIKNILICVPKMNGFRTTWGWVINDRIFIFGWTIPLTIFHDYHPV